MFFNRSSAVVETDDDDIPTKMDVDETPPFNSFQLICKNYKLVMLRDPLSLKFTMAIASLTLGISLFLIPQMPPAMMLLSKIFSPSTWGWLFVLTGGVRLMSLGQDGIPKAIHISAGIVSLYLWVFLNISSFQSSSFDSLNSLLLITVIFEAWLLVHAFLPHRSMVRRSDVQRL